MGEVFTFDFCHKLWIEYDFVGHGQKQSQSSCTIWEQFSRTLLAVMINHDDDDDEYKRLYTVMTNNDEDDDGDG